MRTDGDVLQVEENGHRRFAVGGIHKMRHVSGISDAQTAK
jgi:hypothetical protein